MVHEQNRQHSTESHVTFNSQYTRTLVAMYAYVDCVQYGNVTEAKADCNADC